MEYILSLILFFPIIAGAVLYFIKSKNLKRYAIFLSFFEFLLILFLYFNYDYSANGLEFIEYYPIYKKLNINYYIGIDSISLIFTLLISAISFLSIFFLRSKKTLNKEMFTIFYLETVLIGIFISLNSILFYLFLELLLLPIYLSLAIFNKKHKFLFIFQNLTASFLFIASFATLTYLFYKKTGELSFNIISFYALIIDSNIQNILFFALFIAFILKFSYLPIYSWLKVLYKESTFSGAIFLLSSFPLIIFYGLYRVIFPILTTGLKNSFVPVGIFILYIAIQSIYSMLKSNTIKHLIYFIGFYNFSVVLFLSLLLKNQLLNIAILLLLIHSIVLINLLYIRNFKYLFTIILTIYIFSPSILLYEFGYFDFYNIKKIILFFILTLYGFIVLISSIYFIKRYGKSYMISKNKIFLSSMLTLVFLFILIYPKNIALKIDLNTKPLIEFMNKKAKMVESLKAI